MDLIKGGKILVFHDRYGIPVKAADKERLGEPECGFLFPAFMDRSADLHGVMVYQADEKHPHQELVEHILFQR